MPLGFFSFHGTRSLFFLYQPECKSGCDILFICGLEWSHVNFLIHSRSCTAHYCVQSWLCYYTSNLLFMGGVFFRKDYSGSPVKTAGAFCCLMYAFLTWPITWLTSLHVSHLSHDLVRTFDLVLMSLLVLLFFWGAGLQAQKPVTWESVISGVQVPAAFKTSWTHRRLSYLALCLSLGGVSLQLCLRFVCVWLLNGSRNVFGV